MRNCQKSFLKRLPVYSMKTDTFLKLKSGHLIPFFCLALLFGLFPIKTLNMPYEECNWKSRDYTQRLVDTALSQALEAQNACVECSTKGDSVFSSSETSVDDLQKALAFPIPRECFFAAATRKLSRKGSRTGFYYCKSPESKTPKKSMRVVTNEGKKKLLYPRSPCFNEAYISLIADSFHYMARCFGFNTQERQDIFALFNHESSFVLNKRSNRKARCIGQVTKGTVHTMNRYVYMSNDEMLSSYHNIYREALKNCPDLSTKARLPEVLFEEPNPSYSKLKKINKNFPVSCLTSQDPYACFFYSMYNIKVNKLHLEKRLSSAHENLPQNLEIPESTKDIFQLPIRLNEVLHVREIRTEENGEKKTTDFFFQNDYELMEAIAEGRYQTKNLQIKKATLYNFDEKAKAALIHWSYNGGASIINDYLKEFLTKKKKHIVESTAPQWKKQIKEGQPFDFDLSISDPLKQTLQKLEDIDRHKWTVRDLKKKKPSDYQQSIKEEQAKIKQLEEEIENFTASLRQETLGKGHPPEKFTDYLWLEYNGGEKRRAEVVRFVSKVASDAEDLSNIGVNLKRMHQHSQNKSMEAKQKEFLESLTDKCQFAP